MVRRQNVTPFMTLPNLYFVSILQGRRTQIHPKRIRASPISMNTNQNTPKHHPDIPQTPPRQLQGTQHANRGQRTPTDTTKHTQTAPVSVFGCLAVSGSVCWRLLASVDMSCSLRMPWGCLGDVWVVFGGI